MISLSSLKATVYGHKVTLSLVPYAFYSHISYRIAKSATLISPVDTLLRVANSLAELKITAKVRSTAETPYQLGDRNRVDMLLRSSSKAQQHTKSKKLLPELYCWQPLLSI